LCAPVTDRLGRDTTTVVKRTSNSAYPKVISNLGSLGDSAQTKVAIQMIRFMNHYARNIKERRTIIEYFQADKWGPPRYYERVLTAGGYNRVLKNVGADAVAFQEFDGKLNTKPFMSFMNDHFAVGFANTLGYAHAYSGDTMTSVMIGGLRTVMNGDFEIFAGDLVQFYWAFEKDDFEQDGRRKAYQDIWETSGMPNNLDPSFSLIRSSRKRAAGGEPAGEGAQGPNWQTPEDAQIRQAHYNLSYGQRRDKQKIVAKIKPYFRDDENPRLMDWYRVFGVAIASARPNEMCDIKIARQSM
jgi:hypothetical protein